MQPDALAALTIFVAASAFTPGPNNMLLMTAGVNFGIVRTLPHLAGVLVGFPLMVLLVGFGLAGLFHSWPPAMPILKVAGIAYTLWLAAKVARAGAPHETGRATQPMTFIGAVIFQWVNVKAWTMALTGMALFAPDQSVASVLKVTAAFAIIGVGSASSWLIAGRALRRWLDDPVRLRAFNWTMALLLVGSVALTL